MQISDILQESRAVWGNKKLNLAQIIVRMGKVYGDICRYARGERVTDRASEDELKKELGNLIVSTTRWCDDLMLDPRECVDLAVAAQKRFVEFSGDNKIISMEIKDLQALARDIWQGKKCDLEQVVVRLGKVIGDICRYERNAKPSDRGEGGTGLEKELGNVIFSSICWCADLGYDPEECVKLAFAAQKRYPK
jgi:hypothetical protein